MMQDHLLHQVAFTLIPGLGPVSRKKLIRYFGTASRILHASEEELRSMPGIGQALVKQILLHKTDRIADQLAEQTVRFVTQQGIQPLFITDPAYPQKLLHCPDAPTLLFWKGTADLNATAVLSIIGTRSNSHYGQQVTENLVASLPKQVLVVSGLAYGIDAIAHKAALQNGLHTVGVLAHGLDDLYPPAHRNLAKNMLDQGGLLTEFHLHTKADKYNFPRRNRVVAGMADATVVVETAAKGGSMITADLAFGYNRELFAVPGRLNDAKSAGCLQLIQQQKALLYTGPEQLLETMGWELPRPALPVADVAAANLSSAEQALIRLLQEKDGCSTDELLWLLPVDSGSLANMLLNLEIQNIIRTLPGKRICLL
ncbi:MAG: DNA-processing protein DprA [Sediminibacterium sp.]|nr:DNA-processing protein DprA [Sediminibacterium sp.]